MRRCFVSNGFSREEIGCYVLHQANQRIVEAVAKRLKEPLGKFPMNLQNYGNTSSASIPDSFKRTGSVEKTENRRQNCNGRIWRWTDLGCIYRRMDLKSKKEIFHYV